MLKMLTDYMENGFLENIIDMFRHDKELYSMLGAMLSDERSRVRVGTVALVETLIEEDYPAVVRSIGNIAQALKSPHPTIRGDAAYLLGIIGHEDALPFLLAASEDENEFVREAILESIASIRSGNRSLLR